MGQILNAGVLSGENVNFSPALWSVAAGLNKVHGVWKLYIKGSTYLNPDNFFGLTVGVVYETLIGDKTVLKLPTVPFFIMAKCLDLFEQEDAWAREYTHWIEALTCVQPIHAEITREVSRYKISWFRYSGEHFLWRIQRIAYRSLQLAWQSFKLIMRIMDIVDFMTLDPGKLNELVNQSVRESGLHIPRCLNTLVQNKQFFIKRLEQKEAGIDLALKLLGSQKTHAADIIDKVKSLFDHCERGLNFYEKASTTVGSAVVELGKKFIYDWSPEAFKQILKDQQWDPYSHSENWPPKIQHQTSFKPPKPLLCYKQKKGRPINGEQNLLYPTHSFDTYNCLATPKQNTFSLAPNCANPSSKKILKI